MSRHPLCSAALVACLILLGCQSPAPMTASNGLVPTGADAASAVEPGLLHEVDLHAELAGEVLAGYKVEAFDATNEQPLPVLTAASPGNLAVGVLADTPAGPGTDENGDCQLMLSGLMPGELVHIVVSNGTQQVEEIYQVAMDSDTASDEAAPAEAAAANGVVSSQATAFQVLMTKPVCDASHSPRVLADMRAEVNRINYTINKELDIANDLRTLLGPKNPGNLSNAERQALQPKLKKISAEIDALYKQVTQKRLDLNMWTDVCPTPKPTAKPSSTPKPRKPTPRPSSKPTLGPKPHLKPLGKPTQRIVDEASSLKAKNLQSLLGSVGATTRSGLNKDQIQAIASKAIVSLNSTQPAIRDAFQQNPDSIKDLGTQLKRHRSNGHPLPAGESPVPSLAVTLEPGIEADLAAAMGRALSAAAAVVSVDGAAPIALNVTVVGTSKAVSVDAKGSVTVGAQTPAGATSASGASALAPTGGVSGGGSSSGAFAPPTSASGTLNVTGGNVVNTSSPEAIGVR